MKKLVWLLLLNLIIACSANQYTYDHKTFFYPKLECRPCGAFEAKLIKVNDSGYATYKVIIPVRVFIVGDVYSINDILIKTDASDKWQRLNKSSFVLKRTHIKYFQDYSFSITMEVKATVTLWTNEQVELYYKNTWHATQPNIIK